MIISGLCLKQSIRNYQTAIKNTRENYAHYDDFYSNILFSLLLFIFELVVLVYSINNALTCSKNASEVAVSLILAILFTYPYALVNLTFGRCSKSVQTPPITTSAYY